MQSKRILMSLTAIVANIASAHPGHPALSAGHSHAFFGIDPLYGLLLMVVGVIAAAAIAWRLARGRTNDSGRK